METTGTRPYQEMMADFEERLAGMMEPDTPWGEDGPQPTTPEIAPMAVPCQVMSRVVGYLSAVGGWHAGKQQEFRERKLFRVP